MVESQLKQPQLVMTCLLTFSPDVNSGDEHTIQGCHSHNVLMQWFIIEL